MTTADAQRDQGPVAVVPLHVLGTDVDLRLGGVEEDARTLEEAVRERWHLCLRDPDRAVSRDPDDPDHVRVVEAALMSDDQVESSSAWDRGETDVRDSDLRRLLQRLTQSVTFSVIGARSGELLMLHAAALAHPETGAAAAFVAPGNTGKTTLCRTLGPALTYVSDETLGVRRDGTITPYPKPLSTRRPDWVGVKDEQAPGELGLRSPAVEPWLAGIVLLRRETEHEGPPQIEELDTLDAVMALTPESSAFMKTEGPLRWLADVLERTGGARAVEYAEAADLAPLAEEICGRGSPW
ncbi:hypothetical protein [Ornithinimicrobium sp. Y1694]|uniref:hypothetical protein n=1 Tax=Ornithinimicrobium sp. Y1694 TaxID=3418590 RepID=UPI003CF7A387